MVFVMATLLLVLGIAFFQTIQGAFSALIMAVLTILSAAVAVNYYVPLSRASLSQLPAGWAEYADACCLALLFLVTLVVLRTLSDRFMRGNILLSPIPDRIIAGVISLPTAFLMVGMASMSFQMLPFDQQVMLFNRFDQEGNRASIFPKADDFAAWMVSKLSAGSLSGRAEFALTHPDWPGELSAQRIAIQHESKHAVPASSVKVLAAWKLDKPLLFKKFSFSGDARRGRGEQLGYTVEKDKNRRPKPDSVHLAVRLQVAANAADGDGYHRIAWGQVRLAGFFGDDRRRPFNYYLMGFKDLDVPGEWNYMRTEVPLPFTKEDFESYDYAQPERQYRNYGLVSRTTGAATFDVVFEVPADFQPWFLEYKRWGRAVMPKVGPSPDAQAEPSEGEDQTEAKTTGGVARRGWHSQFQIDHQRTGFTDDLPFRLTMAAGSRTVASTGRLSRGRYADGTITGSIGRDQPDDLDSRTQGRLAVVQSFYVPSDKRLFRLECRLEAAQTKLLQQIFGAVARISQRYVVDKQGSTHFPVGQYVVADVGDGQLVELQYNYEQPSAGGYAKPFRHVQVNQLRGQNARVGFLFLLDSGTALDRFEVGGGPVEAQDLEQYVAP